MQNEKPPEAEIVRIREMRADGLTVPEIVAATGWPEWTICKHAAARSRDEARAWRNTRIARTQARLNAVKRDFERHEVVGYHPCGSRSSVTSDTLEQAQRQLAAMGATIRIRAPETRIAGARVLAPGLPSLKLPGASCSRAFSVRAE